MKRNIFVLIGTFLFSIVFLVTHGQVTVTNQTNTNPDLSASYLSLSAAINDLNAITSIDGPVTISLDMGNPQTAPAGGYEINFANNITNASGYAVSIQGNLNTITAFTPQASGLLTDAIFKVVGADFIVIEDFIMQENSSNTTTSVSTNNMTEWAVALLRKSTTNGAQHNVIQNNEISLNSAYSNTFGIYSNVRHAATNATTSSDITNGSSGPNSYNAVLGNSISNVSMGIAIIGSATDSRMDAGNDIGGASLATGNTITNWGGSTVAVSTYVGNASEYYGIFVRTQKSDNISFNTVTSSTLSGSAGLVRGIHKASTNSAVTGTFTSLISENVVSMTNNLPNNSHMDGIFVENNSSSNATLEITDNTIQNMAVQGNASNNRIKCIVNSSNPGILNVSGNLIQGNQSTATGGTFTAIEQSGSVSGSITISDNIIGNNASSTAAITYSAAGAGTTATLRGIYTLNTNGTPTVLVDNNSFYGFVQQNNSTTANHIYISVNHTTSTASTFTITNNQFIDLVANTGGTAGSVTFIEGTGAMGLNANATVTSSENIIVGSFSKMQSGGAVYCYRVEGASLAGNTMIEENNNFSNIAITGNTTMNGWYNLEGTSGTGPQKTINDNTFSNWSCGTAGATVLNVDRSGSNSTISGNIITNITCNNTLSGILLGLQNSGNVISCSGNNINSLSATNFLYGIRYNTSTVTRASIESNTIHTLLSGSNGGHGIYVDGGLAVDIIKNKIYNIGASNGQASAISLIITSNNNVSTVQNNVIGMATSGTETGLTGIFISESSVTRTFAINYNTIYLNASSSAPIFSTQGLTLPTNSASMVSLRNNIIVNQSTVNGTGIATAIRRTTAGLTNYASTSNNNLLFSGTPSPTRLIYIDGTNADQTLSAYKARVAPRDNLSVSLMPNFVSLTGSSSTFLHLNSTGNCGIIDGGNNASYLTSPALPYLTAIDFDNDARMTTAPYITDIGADEISGSTVNTWDGSTSNDWNDGTNWSLSSVPNSTTENVYVPATVTPQPKITTAAPGPFQVNNLVIESGGLLVNNGTLQIAGAITADAASIDNHNASVVAGSLELNGCVLQFLAGNVCLANDVWNFTSANNVTITSALDVYAELSFGGATNATLVTSDVLTLVSSASRTANVAQIDVSNFISGNVTVERYINTGTGSGEHTKKWQALATPTGANSTSQSVYNSWMEAGNNTSTGYGTHIPDPTGTANGFDYASPAPTIPSIKTYNSGSNAFDPIANTGVALYNKNGYFIFVRGDRSVTEFLGTPTPTNMRSTGELFQPHSGYTPPSTTVASGSPVGKFELVGNPYASAIDIQYMNDDPTDTYFENLTNDITVWDPLLWGSQGLGGYQKLSAITGFEPTPGGTALYSTGVQYPEIQSGQAFFVQTIGNGNIGQVNFDETVKSSNNRLVTRQNGKAERKLFRASLYYNKTVCDGNTVAYDNAFSSEIDANDAGKLQNPGENFMISKNGNIFLTVEAKHSMKDTDSIFYAFSNLKETNYQLRFDPKNLDNRDYAAILVDNYLHTRTAVSLSESSSINFTVDGNTASYENRFVLVFEPRSNIGGRSFTTGLKQNILPGCGSFDVHPNPTENKTMRIHFNNLVLGNYSLQLLNNAAQVVYNKSLRVTSTGEAAEVKLPSSISTGVYQLVVIGADGIQKIQCIIIN